MLAMMESRNSVMDIASPPPCARVGVGSIISIAYRKILADCLVDETGRINRGGRSAEEHKNDTLGYSLGY